MRSDLPNLAQRLGAMRLVAIDEFELDDPGDTVLISTLLSLLADAGVARCGDVQHAARPAG